VFVVKGVGITAFGGNLSFVIVAEVGGVCAQQAVLSSVVNVVDVGLRKNRRNRFGLGDAGAVTVRISKSKEPFPPCRWKRVRRKIFLNRNLSFYQSSHISRSDPINQTH
jgi:hypothetical protein